MITRLLGARRDGAVAYLLITVATFAVTVVAVRWYLELAGYPKIGGVWPRRAVSMATRKIHD